MHEDLGTPYHQQDTDYYCGAACAQMVLDSVGTGLLGQDGLYTDNHNHSVLESGWYTAPDGLQWTLNHRQSSKYFALDALNTEDAISRKIVWTLHHYRVAPVAMVYHSQHWITVRGYTASAAPRASNDLAYTISSFDVNNPWPPTPHPAPPPPHADPDACGGGGARGIADEHITYATWQADYMTGVQSGYWTGKFIAVCDPDPPATHLPRVQAERPRITDGSAIISRDLAVEQALSGLRAHGLFDRKAWSTALDGTSPGEPVLVQRLDRLDSYYWVVPMVRERQATPVAVRVDARYGDYQQSVALAQPSAPAFEELREDAIVERIVNRHFQLPAQDGRLLVRPEALCVYPTYVWRPCRESLSPFYPFRMVTVGGRQLYIRTDGAVFTSLTTDRRGI